MMRPARALLLSVICLQDSALAFRQSIWAEFFKVPQRGAFAKDGGEHLVLAQDGKETVGDPNEEVVQHASHVQVIRAPVFMLPLIAFVFGIVVVVIYAPRGLRVVSWILIYLAALASILLTVKWVMLTNGFKFPKFLSACHFLVGALATGAILAHRKYTNNAAPSPTTREFFLFVMPISLSVVVSIGANNSALVYNSVAFTEIMGSTNSLMTMGILTTLGTPPSMATIPPAMLVACGCILSAAGELHSSLFGVVLCLIATSSRSLKVAFQQRLLTEETKEKFDPVSLLFWTSVPSFVVMWTFSLATEGLSPYKQLSETTGSALSSLLFALGVSCVVAFIQNVAQLFVTKELGAVGSQLAAQTKLVLSVLAGMVLFQEVVTRMELMGFVLVILGVYWFSRVDMEGDTKQKIVR